MRGYLAVVPAEVATAEAPTVVPARVATAIAFVVMMPAVTTPGAGVQ